MSERGKILLVDDEPLIRLTVGAYLTDSGFDVLEAADGAAGLELFFAHRPRVVLTDLRMPRMDGLALLGALREKSPATPVIVITGTGDLEAERHCLELGAHACLYKPFEDLELLVQTLAELLALEGGC